ncbi:probable purine permease 9 [Phtheirospermum japonicum]|uniref:Probable purine permease 9 n=1 Tax=Phtheirospermum japonicum TaxID=374723 RepID=A0A830CAK7_9LAMI|nr:probable purine permease 9 [Phtheirospermum japonicum]
MATLVQVVGFPILFPFSMDHNREKRPNHRNQHTEFQKKHLASFYVAIGIFNAADCMLYSIGIQYLPVTTYTLICASQLAFNAIFSYFLNKQKFTPYIVNSLVLLTISSVLLVFQTDPGDSNKASMYQNLVATSVILVGLFASGDWKRMSKEMRGYESGQVSYVMNLFWTAVSWQVFSVGCVGLIFKVSSLFSNVISILGLPVAPILAVIFISDKLTGLKAVAMLLAVWGFVSYMYQHYLDDLKMKEESGLSDNQQEAALVAERG